MAQLMARRARIFRPSIHVEAAHVIMENIPYEMDLQHMQELCQQENIKLHILRTSFDESTDTRHTHCFLCARYRRKTLFQFATTHQFNKVALGHHQDDFLATALMNLMYEGSFHSMQPSMNMQHYPLSLIRPLCLVPESEISTVASTIPLVKQITPCPYEDNTKRLQMEQQLQYLCNLHSEARQSIWHAIEKGF